MRTIFKYFRMSKPKCKKHLHKVQMYFAKEMNASRGWYNRAITTLHGAEVDAVLLAVFTLRGCTGDSTIHPRSGLTLMNLICIWSQAAFDSFSKSRMNYLKTLVLLGRVDNWLYNMCFRCIASSLQRTLFRLNATYISKFLHYILNILLITSFITMSLVLLITDTLTNFELIFLQEN